MLEVSKTRPWVVAKNTFHVYTTLCFPFSGEKGFICTLFRLQHSNYRLSSVSYPSLKWWLK